MLALERFENRSPTERNLYLLRCDSFADIAPSLATLPDGNFVALIIADFGRATLDALTELSESMIAAGARYFCAWGTNCETAHLAFDLACCEFDSDSENAILTTDHGDESINNAIWYTLNCAYPVDPYDVNWHSIIAICVRDDDAVESVRHAFSDPMVFSEANCPEVDDTI